MSAADRARRSRRAQNLPDRISDPAVYARLAALMVASAGRGDDDTAGGRDEAVAA